MVVIQPKTKMSLITRIICIRGLGSWIGLVYNMVGPHHYKDNLYILYSNWYLFKLVYLCDVQERYFDNDNVFLTKD